MNYAQVMIIFNALTESSYKGMAFRTERSEFALLLTGGNDIDKLVGAILKEYEQYGRDRPNCVQA